MVKEMKTKKSIKSVLALMLVSLMLLTPLLSVDTFAMEVDDDYCGLDLENLYTPNLPSDNDAPSYTNLSSYDPRINNATTPVKSQGDLGVCTLFATNAAFESAVYKQTGMKSSYSEEAMRMVLSKSLFMQNNLTTEKGYYLYGHEKDPRTVEAALQYLTNFNPPIINSNTVNWVAPNYESQVPYTENDEINSWRLNMDTYANAYVTGTANVRISQIKDAILQYGAVYKTFCHRLDRYNEVTASYGVYHSNSFGPDHAIAVVGWDDDYPVENFLEGYRPQNDGAWLIKNSWDTDWGDEGYAWISYEDDSFNHETHGVVITDVDNVSKNEKSLSYDFLPLTYGTCVDLGTDSNCLYTCNVYDVSELNDEYGSINKVTFYGSNIGDFYRVYIAPVNEDGTLPDVDTLTNHCAYGCIEYEGYITHDLQTPYVLDASVDKYAIIVALSSFDEYVCVSQESSSTNERWVNSANLGESYIYEDGSWVDVAEGNTSVGRYNFCIRPVLLRRTPITQDSQLSESVTYCQDNGVTIDINLNGNQIYSIWNSDTLLREDVDFTRDGDSVTLKKSFLDDLSTTNYTNVTFEFTDGANQILKIYPKALLDVTVSGKVAQGQTLVVDAVYSDATVPSTEEVTYQWQSSSDGNVWSDISSANSGEYTLTETDRYKYIRCAVSVDGYQNVILPETKYSLSTDTKVVLYGDVDMNGKINTFDASLVQKYVSGIKDLDASQMVAADVTGDGFVNTFDASSIQKYIAGYFTSFPVES